MYIYKEMKGMGWRKLGAWEGLRGVVMLTEQCTLKPAACKCQDWHTHQKYTHSVNQLVHFTSSQLQDIHGEDSSGSLVKK